MTRLFGVCALLTAAAIAVAQTGEEKKERKRFDAEATFKKLDKDSDGKLTRAEYESMFERFGERGAKFKEAALKRFDDAAGKEKYLTLDQFKKLQPMGRRGGFDREAMFKKLDKDGNGKLTKSEYQAMVDQLAQRFGERLGEEKTAKMKEGMLKRFDEAAGKSGELTLEQYQKLETFPKGEFRGKRKKKNDV